MKHFLLSTLMLLFTSLVVAQTRSREEPALINMAGKIDNEELQKRKRELYRLENMGFFKVLPYDTLNNKVVIEKVIECPGMTKAQITARIKEWCAIKYGNLSAVVHYADEPSGKIIVKGWFPVNYIEQFKGLFGIKVTNSQEVKCWHTISYTIKDGKVKVTYNELRFDIVYGGYEGVPRYVEEMYLEVAFPIIKYHSNIMYERALLILDGINQITDHNTSLARYIKNADKDYGF